MTAATSKDVARIAGVSQSTVSYVMTGKRSISKATRTRVLAAMAQLNFEPNAGARALAGNRTNVVALVAPFGPSTDALALLPFIAGITGAARTQDYEVLLVTSDQGPEGLRRVSGRAMCDGIVMMDIKKHDERIPIAASLPVPVVLIGIPADPQGLHCVDLDFGLAARLAVDELAETVHDRVVFIGHSNTIVEQELNYVSRFLDAGLGRAEHHGIPDEVITLQQEYGHLAAAEAADTVERILVERPDERLGFILDNTSIVRAFAETLATRGVVAGRDVSIIGLCADADAAASAPAITNISVDFGEVSRHAMQIFFQLLASGDIPEIIELVSPTLTRRKTVMAAVS